MIKIFRKIRQRLLTENKFSKYLIYAIGEIVLVVIGILIALQINNANENSKIENIKYNYYSQIVVDLDKEIENINRRIIDLDSNITSSDKYLKYIETPNLETTQIFQELVKVKIPWSYLSFNTNTIQTLESTGDIKLIPKNIRNSLIELKRKQEIISRLATGNYEIYGNVLQKAFQSGYGRLLYKTPKVKELDIKNNIPEIILTLEAGIITRNYTDKLVKDTLLEMLTEIKNIKELINQDRK